jgi:peptidoglycan/LPS O-acetylase OafA/YrhL
VLLNPPRVPGAFADLHYPFVNGAMWTIPHEFRCYLLVPVLGALGLLARPRRYAVLLVALALLYVLRPEFAGARLARVLDLASVLRLALMFAVGGAFRLGGGRIRYDGRGALVAAALLVPALFHPALAEPAFAVCGGYLIFWFALALPPTRLSLAVNRHDPSYGLYLYAWPIQCLVVLHAPALSPWTGAAATWCAALALGLLSWRFLEVPALAQAPRLARLLTRLLTRLRLARRRLPAPA